MKLAFSNALFLLCAWFCLNITVGSYQEKILDSKMQQEANKINNILNDYFEYVNDINVFIGKQIARNGGQDLNFILSVFKDNTQTNMISNYGNVVNNKLFSWSTYDWVDSKNFQLVNTKIGVYKKDPPDMSIRRYTTTARMFPWTLQFDPPSIGNPSKSWVIPAATGVLNNKKEYIGAVVVGINIGLLSNNLEERLNSGLSFVVADEKGHTALPSSMVNQEKQDIIEAALKPYVIDEKSRKPNTSDFIKERPIIANNITFRHIKYMQNYPFMIVVGYDKNLFDYEVARIVRPTMVMMLFLLAYLNFLFFFQPKFFGKETK